jgi:hypothetical protein
MTKPQAMRAGNVCDGAARLRRTIACDRSIWKRQRENGGCWKEEMEQAMHHADLPCSPPDERPKRESA